MLGRSEPVVKASMSSREFFAATWAPDTKWRLQSMADQVSLPHVPFVGCCVACLRHQLQLMRLEGLAALAAMRPSTLVPFIAAVLPCCRPPIAASFAVSTMTSHCALQLSTAVAWRVDPHSKRLHVWRNLAAVHSRAWQVALKRAALHLHPDALLCPAQRAALQPLF